MTPAQRKRRQDYIRAWKVRNRERTRAVDHVSYRARYVRDPEKFSARNRAWRVCNPEKVRASNSAWRARNPEKARAFGRARYREWRARNPEKSRAQGRAYYYRVTEAFTLLTNAGLSKQASTKLKRDVYRAVRELAA